MSQGQALRVLNDAAGPRDWLVVASGTPHVDVHKLWDAGRGARCLMEVGFSCMGGEIPAALGVRMAGPKPDEIYAVIGDGTYLMGSTGELVTARQEGLKITVVVFENGGYQSIHALQRNRTGRSFGLEFRGRRRRATSRSTTPPTPAAWAAPPTRVEPRSSSSPTRSHAARDETGPVVIVVRVEPHRLLLDSECWWDVGVPELSERPETRRARGRARARQGAPAAPRREDRRHGRGARRRPAGVRAARARSSCGRRSPTSRSPRS